MWHMHCGSFLEPNSFYTVLQENTYGQHSGPSFGTYYPKAKHPLRHLVKGTSFSSSSCSHSAWGSTSHQIFLARRPGSCWPILFSCSWEPRLLADLFPHPRCRDFLITALLSQRNPELPSQRILALSGTNSRPHVCAPEKLPANNLSALQDSDDKYCSYTILT